MKKVTNFYNNFAENYLIKDRISINRRHLYIFKQEKKVIKEIQASTQKRKLAILELGCGIGIISEYMKKWGDVIAVDLSSKAIEICRKTVKGVKFICQDVTKLDLHRKFDLITLFDLLEHIPSEKWDNLFCVLERHSHENTIICITIPNPRYQSYVKANEPEVLQIIDEVVEIEYLLPLIKKRGFYLYNLDTFGIDYKEQYLKIVLKRQTDFKKEVQKYPFLSKLNRKITNNLFIRMWRRYKYKKILNKERRKKVFFIYAIDSPFIKKDLELLKKHFQVSTLFFKGLKKKTWDFFKIVKNILWADVSFSWFAGAHAYWAVMLSKILKKKSIVVVGGYEVANFPEIGYGLLLSNKHKRRVKFTLQNANKVLTVDESLKVNAIRELEIEGDNIITVPTGYDYNKWKMQGKKERLVLAVGNVSKVNVKRKGFDTFVKAAKYLPNVKFVLVGKHVDNSIDALKKIASSNVEFPGFMSQDELLKYYQKAKVYCQLSLYEGLPNSLCEAMLCECVPVGTHNSGIPEAIGDVGFYVPYGDIEKTAEAIQKALETSEEQGKKARQRIIQKFPLSRREQILKEIIQMKG